MATDADGNQRVTFTIAMEPTEISERLETQPNQFDNIL